LKISDSLDQFSMEVEIPVDQEDKFVKSFKGKVLAREIDRLHGIDAAICSWTDCTLSNLQKSGGTTNVSVPGIYY
jgi:hypothetical protein